jgi:uncharacterized membrane protein YdbT with pleckstrin-like domain
MRLRRDNMKNQNNTSTSGGIGFVGLLTIVFITLKLTGFISWAWVWVLAPLWIGVAIWIVIIAVVLLIINR